MTELKTVKHVSFYGMYDHMSFARHNGNCLLNVIFNWIYNNSSPKYATYERFGDKVTVDLGPTDLCPAVVVYDDGQERNVGVWVAWGDWAAMYEWIKTVGEDEEVKGYFECLKS